MSERRRSKIVERAEERVRAKRASFESGEWGRTLDGEKKSRTLTRKNSETYKNCEIRENCKNCESSKYCKSEVPGGHETECEITLADIMERKQREKREGIVY